jgi:hypothetical protein
LPNPKNEENKAKEATATQQVEKCVASTGGGEGRI